MQNNSNVAAAISLLLFATGSIVPAKAASVYVTSDSEPGWRSSGQMEAQVRTTLRSVLADFNGGRYERAYAAYDPAFQQNATSQQFAQEGARFAAQTGPMSSLRIIRITWTKPLAGSSLSGVYAAVDVLKTFRNVRRDCGYLVLHLASDGASWKVLRSEDHFMTDATYDGLVQQGRAGEAESNWDNLKRSCPNVS